MTHWQPHPGTGLTAEERSTEERSTEGRSTEGRSTDERSTDERSTDELVLNSWRLRYPLHALLVPPLLLLAWLLTR